MQASLPVPQPRTGQSTSPTISTPRSANLRSGSPASVTGLRARSAHASLPAPFPSLLVDVAAHDAAIRHDVDTLALADGVDSLVKLQSVSDRIRTSIKTLEDLVAIIRARAQGLPKAADRMTVARAIEPVHDSLKRLPTDLRRSIVAAKKALDKLAEAERIELVRHTTGAHDGKDQFTEEDTQRASARLTNALQQAAQMLSAEVDRSAELNRTLAASTQVMASTAQTQQTYSSTLGTSRTLVTRLARRDNIERALIVASFSLFVAAVLWVLGRRVGWGLAGIWRAVSLILGAFGIKFS